MFSGKYDNSADQCQGKTPQILHEQQCCVLVMTAHVKCVKFVLCVTGSLQMFKSPVTLLTGLLHIQKFMKNKKDFRMIINWTNK